MALPTLCREDVKRTKTITVSSTLPLAFFSSFATVWAEVREEKPLHTLSSVK